MSGEPKTVVWKKSVGCLGNLGEVMTYDPKIGVLKTNGDSKIEISKMDEV